ncbi:MAG: enoyl-CoA hydratase-related protein, partial [Actinomycetota bacterium]
MSYEQIVVEDRGPVRLITLSRPEKLNAWTRRMSRELVDTITDGNDDPAIGAFVMTGAGRGFCAGADIGAEFASGASAGDIANRADRATGDESGGAGSAIAAADAGGNDRDWVALVRASKPMVAAINGPAVGVGLTMVLPMDYLVAGGSA